VDVYRHASTLRIRTRCLKRPMCTKGEHGGWGGIRTHGGREPTPVFKTGALNHSTTHPLLQYQQLR
jgi:hypothetical protein